MSEYCSWYRLDCYWLQKTSVACDHAAGAVYTNGVLPTMPADYCTISIPMSAFSNILDPYIISLVQEGKTSGCTVVACHGDFISLLKCCFPPVCETLPLLMQSQFRWDGG